MGQHRLITVGRPRERCLEELVHEYLKRLQGWSTWQWEIVSEEPFGRKDASRAKIREGQHLLGRIHERDFVITLEVGGDAVDSLTLSHRLTDWQDRGLSLAVIVGGSTGLDDAVLARAQWRWSLGPLTLPHALAQVVVAEQLYRAFAIAAGHPYHKA